MELLGFSRLDVWHRVQENDMDYINDIGTVEKEVNFDVDLCVVMFADYWNVRFFFQIDNFL